MRSHVYTAAKIIVSLAVILAATLLFNGISDTLEDNGQDIVAIAANVSFTVLVYFGVTWFNRKYNGLQPTGYGFGLAKIGSKLVTGFLLAVVVLACILGIGSFLGIELVFTKLLKHAAIPLLSIVASHLLVGAWEEMYFRGLVFVMLRKSGTGFHISALITSLLFSILHWGVYDLSETTAFWLLEVMQLAYILLYLYLVTRSIWAPIAFHATWDLAWTLADERENKAGLFHVTNYPSHAVTLDHISIAVLTPLLVFLFLIHKRKITGETALMEV